MLAWPPDDAPQDHEEAGGPAKEAAGKAAPAPKRNAPGIKKATPKALAKAARKPRATIKNKSNKEPPQLVLTEKQQRFVDEYLVDLNGAQAAIRAGYSPETAKQMASENLSKPYLQLAIAEARKAQQERNQREVDMEHLKSETVGTKEAAELLKIHPHSVEKLLREGRIAGAKIGRSWVMMRSDVLAYIERAIIEQTGSRLVALGKVPQKSPQRRRRNFR